MQFTFREFWDVYSIGDLLRDVMAACSGTTTCQSYVSSGRCCKRNEYLNISRRRRSS